MRFAPVVAAIVGLLALPPADASAETRLALVIGNGAYVNTPPLANPRSDAELMTATLKQVGFDVSTVLDADQATMKRALVEFGRKLRSSDAVGLFYYAGHGVQVKGDNYLIPIDANIIDEAEVPIDGVNVNEFLATMERARSRINIVILDACRNNPFPSTGRSAARGLARVEAPSGSYIAYATSPGQVALDGDAGNSPYTRALADSITTRGVALEDVFKRTRKLVQDETGAQQTPWETSSITGDFFFVAPAAAAAANAPEAAVTPVATSAPPPRPDPNVEIAFWNSIRDSNRSEAFQTYIQQYPTGAFSALAKLKLKELTETSLQQPEARATPVPAPAPPPPSQQAMIPQGLFPLSSTSGLLPEQLAGLDCDQLWIARNEIFARNGYCFQTGRGLGYFGNANCRTTSQDILNRVEQQNVALIKSWEGRNACR